LPSTLLKCVIWSNNIFLVGLSQTFCNLIAVTPDAALRPVRSFPMPRDFLIASHAEQGKCGRDAVRFDGTKIRLVNSRNAVEWSLRSGRISKAKRFGTDREGFVTFLDKLELGFQ
jgi:hypothetical protein